MRKWGAGYIPFGLIGMLLLVALIENLIRHRSHDFGERRAQAWRYGRQASENAATRCRILCLGDSLVKLGVLPRILSARLGQPVWNVAVPGGQASSSYFLLRRALERGAPLQAVIVDFHPNLLAVPPRFNTEVWPELVSLVESARLSIRAGDPELFARIVVAKLFASVEHREGLRDAILAGLGGRPNLLRIENLADLRNWRVNGGAHVAAYVPQPLPDQYSPGEAPRAGGWSPHPSNRAYLRRFLDLAASRHLTVFWLIPPATPDWLERRTRLGFEASYEQFAREMLHRYGNLVVVDGRYASFGPTAFRDSTHLHRKGAVVLTETLAEILERRQAIVSSGSRWVRLPAYREIPDPFPLEDVDQSRIAIQFEESKRR